jgi:hypothetical protein
MEANPSFKNEVFLSQTHPSIIAETCIVAFTIVSYLVPKQAKLVGLFQECLAHNINKLLYRHEPVEPLNIDTPTG